jgi:Zn-dependent M32 family carboxypeptidase
MNIEEHKEITHEAEIQLDEINRLLKLYEKEQSVETADQVISAYKKQIGLLGKIIESRTRSDVVLVNTTSAM